VLSIVPMPLIMIDTRSPGWSVNDSSGTTQVPEGRDARGGEVGDPVL
jgi:hypothetical protein